MVEIKFSEKFILIFSMLKDNFQRTKIKKHVKKIADNPKVGKPMKFHRKGTRELYLKPYRLSYVYDVDNDIVCFKNHGDGFNKKGAPTLLTEHLPQTNLKMLTTKSDEPQLLYFFISKFTLAA